MKFEGALLKEQGVTFAIVVVKSYVMSSIQECDEARTALQGAFPGVPIILMAQDSRGTAMYQGRKDIVNFLSRIHISQIPWKQYTYN